MKRTKLIVIFMIVAINFTFAQDEQKSETSTTKAAIGTPWIYNGSKIYYNGGNVGIGASSPGEKLEIAGNIKAYKFIDKNSTSYYVDPSSTSNVYTIKSNYSHSKRFYDKDNPSYYIDPASTYTSIKIAWSIDMPLGESIVLGTISELQNRLRITHSGKHAYIDFKDNLHFRADRNWISPLIIQGDGNVAIGYGTTYATDGSQYQTHGYKLGVKGDIYIESNYNLRIAGTGKLRFHTYGGGFYMQDNTWIRTYGNKSFYHNTGTMRTDGTFQVGPSGNRFIVKTNGNVGIGTTGPDFKLDVNGVIRCEGIEVIDNVPSSDYVFKEDYDLKSIKELEKYIKIHNHLPDVPSAAEFKENGYNVGEMDDLLLRKIEEITLYIIALKKDNEKLSKRIKELEK